MRQAEELQKKLEYVNSHQKCELAQVQRELKSCNQELVQLRAKSHDDKILKTDSGSAAKLKSIEQELILVKLSVLFFFWSNSCCTVIDSAK